MGKDIIAEVARKQAEAMRLTRELQTYVELRKLGINKEDINGKRRVKKPWSSKNGGQLEFCTETCQVRMKDGSEHIVPYHLIYGEE